MSKNVLSLISFIFCFTVSYNSYSQDALTVLQNGGNLDVLYRNERNMGVMAHTNGIGLNYRRIRHITGEKRGIFEVEVLNMHHYKEVKSANHNIKNGEKYSYGKLNYLQIIRPGVGYQKVIYRKAERKSVEIRFGTFVGASLAFVKPVYLKIMYDNPSMDRFILKDERYDPNKHTQDNIYGKSFYFKSIGETKLHPGAYVKFALSFEYADYHNDVKAIETGITIDAYPSIIPLMAYNKNQQLLVNLYVSLMCGKKWF